MKNNLKKTIQTLTAQWGLAQDISLDELLLHVEEKISQQPDNPELNYLHAELLRKTGKTKAATTAYQEVVEITKKRTNARGKKLSDRVTTQQQQLRKKMMLLSTFPLLLIALIFGGYWYSHHQLEALQKEDGNPKNFAFIQWLAKQQAAKIVSNLQAANPNLSFDFSSNAMKSGMTLSELMESLVSADTQNKLRESNRNKENENQSDDLGNKEKFNCATDTAIRQCDHNDMPTATGEKRNEIVLLMRAYRSILSTEKDCEKLEQSIDQIGQQLQWRKSEKSIKADMEDYAIECFYRQNKHQKVIEHARKLQCADEPHLINSVYWYLTASTHQLGNVDEAKKMYNCFNQAVDYKAKYYFDTASIAARHRESGALAWLYFDDLDAAVVQLEKARDIIKSSKQKNQLLSYVQSEIDLDLLETYVTANIAQDTFEKLHLDINSSGYLTDGYKQIKDTLAGIYYLQNHQNNKAKEALSNVIQRFKQMPEYICSWDWSGFQRGLSHSIKEDALRDKANTLVIATNCYVPQSNADRMKKINTVINSLNR